MSHDVKMINDFSHPQDSFIVYTESNISKGNILQCTNKAQYTVFLQLVEKCWMKQLAVTHFLPRSFLQEPPYFGCLPRMSAISGIQLANNPYNREIHNLVTCNIEPQVKRHYFLDMLYNTNNWVASLWKEFEKNILWCLYNFSKTFLYIQVFV